MFARFALPTRTLAASYGRLHSRGFAANTFVLADHDNKTLGAGTLNAVTAGKALGGDVTVGVLGSGAQEVADAAAALEGVSKVVLMDSPALEHGVAEALVPAIRQLHSAATFTHILAPATSTGKNALPRLAAELDVMQISDVTEVKGEDTFVRPIYAGNALATVQSKDAVKVMTVRTTAFDKAAAGAGPAPIEKADAPATESPTSWVGAEISKSERPDLASASTVVSGGRGMKNGENFAMLEELASHLDAALGASRAAVDAGFVPNELQVGQTGKVVAPDLYIAVGISGAIQHLAGMKDSKTIVAINKDPEAPIFQVADYGLVADLFEAVPQLTAAVKK
eukprot:TRINITY_DN1462_c0_g2_i1.p1 TRINITY_DN1462_c0_g2~~TRINITY_DN1462_c0_g2_i1.p1  ORF type:complete len:347 (+),score=106.43 TRINITY_DN1462_c0_g2_i1:27-1043(+)